VASKACRIRKREALSFDVVVGISVVGQRFTSWSQHTIRRFIGFIQLHSQGVAAEQGSERLTAGSPVNAPQLPSAKCPLRQSSARSRSGQLPSEVESKILAHIEVRQAPSCTLVKEKRVQQPVRIRVVSHRRRECVDALAPGVCTTKLHTE